MSPNPYAVLESPESPESSPGDDKRAQSLSETVEMPASSDTAEAPPSSNFPSTQINTSDTVETQPFNPSLNRSIADVPTYTDDVRRNPATDHRRDALGPNQTGLLTVATSEAVAAPAAGHRRNVSSISDFAYPPTDAARHGTMDSIDVHASENRRTGSINSEFAFPLSSASRYDTGDDTTHPAREHDRFDSIQTTAVNTTRSSSFSSPAPDPWDKLKDIVSTANPGVQITIHIYTSESPPLGIPEAEEDDPNVVWTRDEPQPASSKRRCHIVCFTNKRPTAQKRLLDRFVPPKTPTYKEWFSHEASFQLAPWMAIAMPVASFFYETVKYINFLAIIYAIFLVVWASSYGFSEVLEYLIPWGSYEVPAPDTATWVSHAADPSLVAMCPSPELEVFRIVPACPLTPPQRKVNVWLRGVATILAVMFVAGGCFVWLLVKGVERERKEQAEVVERSEKRMEEDRIRAERLIQEDAKRAVQEHFGVRGESSRTGSRTGIQVAAQVQTSRKGKEKQVNVEEAELSDEETDETDEERVDS